MKGELAYFLAAVLYGFFVSACYHSLVFLRSLFRHAREVTDAQDILFFSAAGVAFFLLVLKENDGILRWYAFFGAGAGCCLYVQTLCVSLERVRNWLLQKRKKAYKIKAKKKKGRVSVDEGSNPEHRKKKEKEKRT